jgi:hypothetical protein
MCMIWVWGWYDCFVCPCLSWRNRKSYWLRLTEAMQAKATENTVKLGFSNIEFIKG